MSSEKRRYYLHNVPMAEARERLAQALIALDKHQPLAGESIPLTEALGRITAGPIWAKMSVPHYHAAAMDGYAVRAVETNHATETQPITLSTTQFAPVNTGEPLPNDTNAVIMIEHVQPVDDGIQIIAPVPPWQHVRIMGEDMIETELVLPANHKIRPVDLGAVAACGHDQVDVRRKPHVVIIPTGDELISVGTEPTIGQTIEFNSLVLQAQLQSAGCTIDVQAIQADNVDTIRQALLRAIGQRPDLVLILSGSSAGNKDYTASIIERDGKLLVHGIAVRPGHPVIIGVVNETPVFGVPGYPVSATLTGELFIEPLIAQWLGQRPTIDVSHHVQAQFTRRVHSPSGDDEYVRVTVAQVGEKLLATPIQRGAGVITSLVRADGLAHIPRFTEGIDQGQYADIRLYRTPHEIANTILMIGSHDPMIDLLAQYIAAQHPGFRLTSVNIGSMGGIIALKRGEAHIAGMHLLDTKSGTYNVSHIQQYLPDTPLQLVTFAHREQGLMVPKGNPLNIQSLEDLRRVRYVNRQRGSGTRLLLDYELQQRGIKPEDVPGYTREEYTHLAVAVAVATGIADCGIGVRRATFALDLDFIPIAWERYDIAIPTVHSTHVAPLLDTLHSPDFYAAFAEQPGYNLEQIGRIQFQFNV